MVSLVNTPLEYFKYAYGELLPEFLDEVIESGSDIDALSSATAHLCENALELSKVSHSFAVLLIDFTGFSDRFDTHYFDSNVVSEGEFQEVLKPLTRYLSEHPMNSTEYFTYEQIGGQKTNGQNVPESILVTPIFTASSVYGYTVVFYHDNYEKYEADDPRVTFISRCMHVVSLALECEFNKAVHEHHLVNDYLTGLPNRDYVYEAIVYMLQTAEAFGHRFALMVVRVSGLKDINNALGMQTGDLMLKAMGAIIESVVRESTEFDSLTGRLGGGDFAVLVTLPSDGADEEKDNLIIETCCRAIIKETGKHVEINGYKLYPSVNVGASIYPTHGETTEELLRKADLAKNDAKLVGPGTFNTYKNFMDGDAEEVLFLNSNLPTAVSTNQFELFYQAMVDIKTGLVTAAEALIRWNHPTRGLVRPDKFIPFAERNSYGIPIDLLVLEMACKQINKWCDKGYNLTVSVNTSPRHFKNGLIYDSVHKALESFDIDPSFLRLELLENILLDDFNAAIKVIKDLRSLGVGIALDDFGSGYSSLEYVSKLPMDYLKIDRTFMMNVQTNPNNKVILETIMTLAKGMKVKTVAEGVERREDFHFLRDIGCDVAQGYFISKPMNVEAFEEFLASWQHI